jgi:hypothetical protein
MAVARRPASCLLFLPPPRRLRPRRAVLRAVLRVIRRERRVRARCRRGARFPLRWVFLAILTVLARLSTAPTRSQLHHYIWDSLCQVINATHDVTKHPRHQVPAVVTGSAALWAAMYPSIKGPRCGDGTKQEETEVDREYWLPGDIDIPIRTEIYQQTIARLASHHHVKEVEGKHNGFKFHIRSQEHTAWPPIQVYPVCDVLESVAKHDIEAVRCWGTPQAGTVSIRWCEGVDPKRVLKKRISFIYGAHRPLGCLQHSNDVRCRFLNGIPPGPDAQELVDRHPKRCQMGEERVRKYRDRGFTLLPAAESEPGTCPYCGADDVDPPEAQQVGMAGDQPTAEEQAAREAEDAALRTLTSKRVVEWLGGV